MATTNFAVPILEGKTEAWKAACKEMAGPRREEYLASRRALGITKEIACLQETPHGDYVVVHIEANDVSGIMQGMMQATDAFAVWFKEAVFKDIHGMDGSGPVPSAPPIFIDIL
ncbi:MAG: hypothetical protein J4N69_11360 [Chloroflexi bacterium]|nr:hypothetical protein [Chloroflexota bacterium]MCI0901429.1 hypothetical protein [Chloroflexota bacterium]